MAAAEKLVFGGGSASAVELAGYEELLLSEEAFSTSDDLDEYSFSGVRTDIFKGLNSAEKVSQLDLNAMGSMLYPIPVTKFTDIDQRRRNACLATSSGPMDHTAVAPT
jgi:hypothetical protein